MLQFKSRIVWFFDPQILFKKKMKNRKAKKKKKIGKRKEKDK
jgi:hypothetical protein